MQRTLWCMGCGQSRTIETAGAGHRHGCAPFTCFRCGDTVFTTVQSTAPRLPAAGFMLTASDRQFLRALGISREVVR